MMPSIKTILTSARAPELDASAPGLRSETCASAPACASTFADCFCAQHGIGREHYGQAVFRHVLYRRARPFTRLLVLMNPDYFTPDHEIIRNVAPYTHLRDFASAVENFRTHPRNRGALRWRFSMRISTTRLRTLIKETFLRAGIGMTPEPAGGETRPAI